MCCKYHTNLQTLYALTQPRYGSSRSFPCAKGMDGASACACECVCHPRMLWQATQSAVLFRRFCFLGAVSCFCVCITPSSEVCTLWRPWCNGGRMSRCSLCGNHERALWLVCVSFLCFILRVSWSIASRTCSEYKHKRHPCSTQTSQQQLYNKRRTSHRLTYISHVRRNACVLPFQLATSPGFQANHIPKGNLVRIVSHEFVRQRSSGISSM